MCTVFSKESIGTELKLKFLYALLGLGIQFGEMVSVIFLYCVTGARSALLTAN